MTAALLLALVSGIAVPLDAANVCTLRSADRRSTASYVCLSCHDGSVGPAISTAMGSMGSGSHRVGVDYASGLDLAVGLRRYGPRDARVTLPGGRVECVTCHDARGAGPHRTVTSFGALCTACHDK